jgi:hypothetical protein
MHGLLNVKVDLIFTFYLLCDPQKLSPLMNLMTFRIIPSPAKNRFASTTVLYVYNMSTLVAIPLLQPSFHLCVMTIWFLQV